MAISDAGWGTRGNGEPEGGYTLCLTSSDMLEQASDLLDRRVELKEVAQSGKVKCSR